MTAFLVGGYSADMGGTATGIGLVRADGAEVEFLGTVAPCASPSWLLVHGDRVYAVGEGDSTVSVWRFEGARLVFEGTVAAGGDGPCHLALDGDGLLVSCYGGGVLTRVPLAKDGSRAGDGAVVVTGAGGGPHPDQVSGHLHAAVVRPDGRVVALDLGSDIVHLLDAHRGREAAIALPAGTGPRDVHLLPDGRMLVLGELAHTLLVLSPEGESLGMTCLPGAEPGDHAAALAVTAHGDGWRVVTGLRGSDRVAVLDVAVDGTVTPVVDAPAEGAWPRHLVLDGDVIRVANERSSQISSIRLAADGTLHPLGAVPCPSPTILVPVPDVWLALAR